MRTPGDALPGESRLALHAWPDGKFILQIAEGSDVRYRSYHQRGMPRDVSLAFWVHGK